MGIIKYLHEVQISSQWIFPIANEAFKVKQDGKDNYMPAAMIDVSHSTRQQELS